MSTNWLSTDLIYFQILITVLLFGIFYATRSEDKIHQWIPMHDYARRCVCYNIPSTVNNTPIISLRKYIHIVYKVSPNILN